MFLCQAFLPLEEEEIKDVVPEARLEDEGIKVVVAEVLVYLSLPKVEEVVEFLSQVYLPLVVVREVPLGFLFPAHALHRAASVEGVSGSDSRACHLSGHRVGEAGFGRRVPPRCRARGDPS